MRKVVLAILLSLLLAASARAALERGPLISMELRDVEIKEVLRAIGQEHDINIIADDSIAGTVTVSLRGVPLWDALDSILRSKGYTYRIQPGGLVIIELATKALLAEEDLLVREFKLKYLDPASVLSNINSLLTSRGKATLVNDINSIIVKDLALGIERVEAMLEKIDKRPKQIMIEARIVELSTSYSRELGVQWGPTGYNNPNSVFNRPGSGESRFAVNLPKPSSIGGDLIFGLATNTYSLNLKLSALEDTGVGKVLSRPKIMVLDNQEAEITSGTEILVPTIVNAVVTGGTIPAQGEPKILEAKLELTVTPRVVDDNLLSLVIDTRREEFDFSREVQGYPPKESRTARTELMVKNGSTIVIGGIYTTKKTTDESSIPILGKIPLLGWLFKSQTKRDEQAELLIFLTPTIAPEDQEQWSQQTP
jgi:type IV pilus assembly protein PilQ